MSLFRIAIFALLLYIPEGGMASNLCPPMETSSCEDKDGRVRLVTFDSIMNTDTVFLRGSSAAMGFSAIEMLGFGARTGWGRGMEHKLNSYRDYAFNNSCGCDISILVDSSDVIVVGSPEEIRSKFIGLERKWGLSLFFAAEPSCTQWGVTICDRLKERTAGKGPWRFLNSGLLVARTSALRKLFHQSVDKPLAHDQEWMREQFLARPDLIGIDFDADLLMVPYGIDNVFNGSWSEHAGQPRNSIVFRDGAIHNTKTGTKPLLLHFPGPGHWPGFILKRSSHGLAELGVTPSDVLRHWIQGDRCSCSLLEFFLHQFPRHAKQLRLTDIDYTLPRLLPSLRTFCAGNGRLSPFRVMVDMLDTLTAACVIILGLMLALFLCCGVRLGCASNTRSLIFHLPISCRRLIRTKVEMMDSKDVDV